MRDVPIRAGTICLVVLAISGCVTGPEHLVLRTAGTPVELVDVPFFAQDEFQCGPAALATVLVDAGVDVTPQALQSQVYIPDRRGSLQAELLAATRRHGRVPYVLPGSLAFMLDEIRDGRPVLLLQNLGIQRWPVWHYAVLVGFDPGRDRFLLRSGTTPRQQSRARNLLASWDKGGRWSIVVVSPSDPPVSADVLGWLRAVAPFESTGNLDLAREGYEAAITRWPDEAIAWTALGNVNYLQEDLQAAEESYSRALTLSESLWTARNNLIRTLVERGCAGRAEPWVRTAGEPPPEFASTWQQTLVDLAAAEDQSCGSSLSPQ
ncbi:MAG TPA: PA2778 family cysteine peptidase [Woeseiaceae bacterium]